ncbi:MAG: GatB/YqeY domain-containing protein [Actinomycetes bacterium]
MATPELKDRLQSDLTDAIRSRDELRASTLRMALTAVKSAEVAGSAARTLSDDEVLAVLRTEVKKRREAAEAFDGAGRPERAERERAEQRVLEGYLPAQLSDDDLAALVADAVAQAAAAGQAGTAAMGRVMGIVKPAVGQRADGARVAAEVRRQLQG